jgi:rhamnosyl/mannosyltransferase
MKVLQLSKFYFPYTGGIEKVVFDIAEGLADKVDMNVLVCQPKGKGRSEFSNGIKIIRAGSFGIYFSMPVSLSFPFLLKKIGKDIDILHFHMPFPLADLSYLWIRPQGKVVVWWHSDIVKQRNLLRMYKPFMMRFLEKAHKIIVATPQHIESSPFLKNFREKCVVIPFGIDINRFRLNDKMREKVAGIRNTYGSKIILFVGRLVYYKGVEYLVEAMKEVDAKLLLVGEGPLKEGLINLADKIGIRDKIVFMGRIDDEDLIHYYHACSIFVLPSIANSEAFGIVQLEAMACGKPVINTELPTGVPWVSVHGETGITVPPRDSSALADALNVLLNNADLCAKYGQNARKRVEEEFTMKLMMDRVLSVYKQVTDNKKSGGGRAGGSGL